MGTDMKTVLVTGGSSGIGAATVKIFADAGYKVFSLDKDTPTLIHAHVTHIACDVSQLDALEAAVQQIKQSSSSLDVVVSAAGQYISASIEETTEADYDRIMNVNLKGSFFLLKAVLPIMKAQKHGSIVLVASDQSLVGKTRSAAYGASKAALAQLAKSTALDYAHANIRVNAVCPGTIDTPLYRHAIQRSHEKSGVPLAKIEHELAEMQPLRRIGLSPEVADAIFFLSSDAAAFITGALLPIDGGYIAQ